MSDCQLLQNQGDMASLPLRIPESQEKSEYRQLSIALFSRKEMEYPYPTAKSEIVEAQIYRE